MPKRPLPTLTQLNVQTAIANMVDQADLLSTLLGLPLPIEVTRAIARAIALNAVAQSHFKVADDIATDRLMGNGRPQ